MDSQTSIFSGSLRWRSSPFLSATPRSQSQCSGLFLAAVGFKNISKSVITTGAPCLEDRTCDCSQLPNNRQRTAQCFATAMNSLLLLTSHTGKLLPSKSPNSGFNLIAFSICKSCSYHGNKLLPEWPCSYDVIRKQPVPRNTLNSIYKSAALAVVQYGNK